jgi:hypothetical protein
MPKVRLAGSQLNPAQWYGLHCYDPYLLFSGGVGSGKTTFLAMKMLDLRSKNPKAPGLVVAPSWSMMKAVTLRALNKMLWRVYGKEPKLKDPSGERYLDFGKGPPVFLRTATNPGSIEGIDVGWLLGDELRWWPWKSYENAIARVRVPCALPQACFATTPEIGKMSDEFNSGKDGRRLIRVPTIENIRNLRPGYVDDLSLSYSPRMRDAILYGMFVLLEGAVYENLTADIWNQGHNVIDYDPDANLWRKTYLIFDPGYQKSSWAWVHELTPTSWVIFDQFQVENTSDAACVDIVNARGWPIDEIWCDPAADNTQSALDLDTLDIAQSIIFRGEMEPTIRYPMPPFNRIRFGVDKVRTMLGDEALGLPPRLFFANRLRDVEEGQKRGVVKCHQNYRYYPEKYGQAVRGDPWKDGVNDHCCDMVRYFSVGMWLTSPLRSIDRSIEKMAKSGAGYREAA